MAFVQFEKVSVRYGSKIVLRDISFCINGSEHILLSGESGSGKTTLGKAIAGFLKYDGDIKINFNKQSALLPKVLFVENWYRFTNLEGDRNFYYQQRYNHQQKRETVTIAKELDLYGKENNLKNDPLHHLIRSLHFSQVLDEQLFEISSGEHKKLQLIKALWLQPQLLIIDQPYNGLDAASRKNLNQLLLDYGNAGGTLLLISNDEEQPGCIKKFLHLQDGSMKESDIQKSTFVYSKSKSLPDFLNVAPCHTSTDVANLTNVKVKYDEKIILDGINWNIRAGERWLLQGPNGSGKSTLLSLITADHPQAYANDVKIFGVQRGAGESIWDIKQKMGIISPELHWYFDSNATVSESIASGFFDSNGLYQQLRYAQKQQLNELLHFLNLYEDRNELLSSLPLGKQRLALLGRTIIKNPQLLILDEPCQGLDRQQTKNFNNLIDEISKNGVTIIYVGHFETQLPKCLDHKLVLEDGKVIFKS